MKYSTAIHHKIGMFAELEKIVEVTEIIIEEIQKDIKIIEEVLDTVSEVIPTVETTLQKVFNDASDNLELGLIYPDPEADEIPSELPPAIKKVKSFKK
jgi:hypothetical protein